MISLNSPASAGNNATKENIKKITFLVVVILRVVTLALGQTLVCLEVLL